MRASLRFRRFLRLGLISIATVSGVCAGARFARAQTRAPAAEQQSVLTPPRLLSHIAVAYPTGQTGDVTVTVDVTLVVGVAGNVEEATPSDTREPFRTLAQNAGLNAQFEPARRGDKPVRARIRIELAFHEPTPSVKPSQTLDANPAENAPANEAAKPAPAILELEEVRVLGAREVLGPVVISLGRAEVRLLPGAFGDPYRAIDVLPGVTPTVSGLPYYYIRGAPPSNVNYLVDGVRVPYLFHFGLGPGVIQPSLVERVDLYPGALPTRFGGVAGAVVSGETATPKDKTWGEASIRLIDTGGYVEAPLLDGRMHVGVGGRFSYTAFLLSAVAPDVSLGYRDYNARIAYDLTPKDRLTLFTFGAFDLASNKDSDGNENVLFASEFHRLDLRWDRRWDNGGS